MGAALALIEPPDDLVARLNEEHLLAMDAAGSMLLHAIAAGELLLQARMQVPEGEWCNWLDNNFVGARKTARAYMRCAHYREVIADAGTITEALEQVRGLPWITGTYHTNGTPALQRAKERAKRAREALRRQERDRAMRKIGGTVGECYSMIRRTAQTVDSAMTAEATPEVRTALESALADLHRAEDQIVRAVGIT